MTFSESGFRARHLRGRVRPDFRLHVTHDQMFPGESSVVWVHSYYPWAAPARKRWDYSAATLATSPSCDEEPDFRGFWWRHPCHGPKYRDTGSWLSCSRFNFLGAVH